jgi:hypothetical protein
MVLYRELSDQSLMRRITYQGGSVSSTAGGVMALATFSSDVARTNGLEFANYSARYGQFRVHKMRLIATPCFPGSGSPTLSAGKHATMFCVGQRGDTNPTATTLLSNPDCKIFSSDKKLIYSCSWRKFLDAHLYSSVNSAIPTDQQLKIFFASSVLPTGLLPVSEVIYTYCIIFDVEFSQPI